LSQRPPWILPAIVLAQFAGTSLWFSANAVLDTIQQQWGMGVEAVGWVTAAVQLGFIAGTFVFAALALSDRFSPRIVFFFATLLGAAFNAMILWLAAGVPALLLFRALTGFCLAGIYPVGMKIAAGWFEKGLGHALGFLLGAQVLGTAFPHLIKSAGVTLDWTAVMAGTSALAVTGGLIVLVLVPDGPYMKKGRAFSGTMALATFRSPRLRAAAFGYFGHMWELYAMRAFTPLAIGVYAACNPGNGMDPSFWSFLIIAAGSIGCIGGGLLTRWVAPGRVAAAQLAASGLCCLASPLFFSAPPAVFAGVMIVWGMVVVGDSPQFSTVIAGNAPPERVGSALTLVNGIGFSITVVSIELLSVLSEHIDPAFLFLFLTPGPILGLIAMRPIVKK
jgi:MFS family permease